MSEASANLIEEMVTLKASDGGTIGGFRVSPAGAAKGGLIVLQEIFGLTDQMKSVARFYAAQGYDAIVPCLYDRTEPGLVVPFSDPDRGRNLAYGLDMDAVTADIAAAADAVKNPNGISVVGFCWGGGVMVRAAADVALKGGIAFYGTRLDTYLDYAPKCPMLFHFGTTDPNSPPELIEKVTKTFPAAGMHLYEAGHAFANDVRPSYDKQAADLAISRTLDFLSQVHGA